VRQRNTHSFAGKADPSPDAHFEEDHFGQFCFLSLEGLVAFTADPAG
jgi:hypothetical protein